MWDSVSRHCDAMTRTREFCYATSPASLADAARERAEEARERNLEDEYALFGTVGGVKVLPTVDDEADDDEPPF